MKALLDTHALLWILSGDSRLSDRATRAWEEAEQISFSIVSLWEIGVKLGLGRKDFVLDSGWWREIPSALTREGGSRLDVDPEHCREVSRLPLHHRDPFDRMLIAQARLESLSIISIDAQLDPYGIERVW